MTQNTSDSTESNKPSVKTKQKEKINYLLLHRLLLVVLYIFAVAVAYLILNIPEAHKSIISLLSTTAIFATLGAAMSSIGSIFERDLLERVKLNVDIFYRDIIHQSDQWRRWSFLPRKDKRKMLNDDRHHVTLTNPVIPLDVGTHVIEIDFPTVLEDFFDLPVIRNVWKLNRFRRAAHTSYGRRKENGKNSDTGMEASDEYMAYECIFDIWISILKFRIARYIIHFGSALIFGSISIMMIFVFCKYYA